MLSFRFVTLLFQFPWAFIQKIKASVLCFSPFYYVLSSNDIIFSRLNSLSSQFRMERLDLRFLCVPWKPSRVSGTQWKQQLSVWLTDWWRRWEMFICYTRVCYHWNILMQGKDYLNYSRWIYISSFLEGIFHVVCNFLCLFSFSLRTTLQKHPHENSLSSTNVNEFMYTLKTIQILLLWECLYISFI